MNRIRRTVKAAALLLIMCLLPLYAVFAEESAGSVISERVSDSKYGKYTLTTVRGLTPYVYMPTGAAPEDGEDVLNVANMMNAYGAQNRFVLAVNAGIFYAAEDGRWYGFSYKEEDGPTICNGVVLKSAESVDHTECTLLVIDEDGNIGYAPFDTDADALVSGTATWFDIHGAPVTGKKILSAVTGFVPIVIDGKLVYNSNDKLLHGYMNYVGHYSRSATRQVLGVREDGSILFFTNDDGWTLLDAARVALRQNCVFAYNLDGGKSAQTVLGKETDAGYETETVVGKGTAARTVPTYIVFTADDCMPVSADPIGWEVEPLGAPFDLTAGEIAKKLLVTVRYLNANGNVSERTLISSSAAEPGTLIHETWGGSTEYGKCRVLHTSETRGGVLICAMTPSEASGCVNVNRNVRKDGLYYDYSTGYTLSMEGDSVLLRYQTGDLELSAELSLSGLEQLAETHPAVG